MLIFENNINGRSKKQFTKALFSLMEENQFDQITVTQLAQEAVLTRKTFYRHYRRKEDILTDYLNYLGTEYVQLVTDKEPYYYKEVIMLYFEFWLNHRDFLHILIQSQQLHILSQFVEDVSIPIFRIVKSKTALSNNDELLFYALSYSLGGLNNLLLKWYSQGMNKTPTELATIILESIEMFVL